MDNRFYFPVKDISIATGSDGVKWVVDSLYSISTKDFWIIVSFSLAAILINMFIGMIPIIPTIVSTLGIAASFIWLVESHFLKNNSIGNITTTCVSALWNISIFVLLKMALRIVLYGFLYLLLLIFMWNEVTDFIGAVWDYGVYAVNKFQGTVYQGHPETFTAYLEWLATDLIRYHTDLFRAMIVHLFIGSVISMIVELIVYCCDFFAIPLMLYSRINPLKAMWLSFVAVNKNIWSFTMFGIAYLFLMVFVLVLVFILVHLLAVFGLTIAILWSVIAFYVLSIMHIVIQHHATARIFWNSFSEASNQQNNA